MCKRDASKPADGLTEECFEKTPLAFAGGMQWVQFGNDTSRRVSFRANRTSTGTVPAGSTCAPPSPFCSASSCPCSCACPCPCSCSVPLCRTQKKERLTFLLALRKKA